uniref:NAD kinase 2, mitochondrial n=1 Tax=Oryzias melastigma TaxID=30732 RepID=A0A3B3C938_ORYME
RDHRFSSAASRRLRKHSACYRGLPRGEEPPTCPDSWVSETAPDRGRPGQDGPPLDPGHHVPREPSRLLSVPPAPPARARAPRLVPVQVRFQAREGGGSDQNNPVRVRAAAVPIRGTLRGGPEAAARPEGLQLQRPAGETQHPHQQRGARRSEPGKGRHRGAGGEERSLQRGGGPVGRCHHLCGGSEGHLCLPVRYTRAFPEALDKLCRGEFRWLWRQRIRLHLGGTGINPTPVDLHEQQLSLEQHSQAHRSDSQQRSGALHQSVSTPSLLPVRGLNEIFIGESLSSSPSTSSMLTCPELIRASYYEISVEDGPWEKQKSSGLSICTGTGSKAWSYNINKLSEQAVEEVLKIGRSQAGVDVPLSPEFIERVTDQYNESLVFSPDDRRLLFSIREPIVNRVFSSSRQRGFASKVCVRSRCWDACMVVDGGTSFEFNDGAIATISTSEEDQLRTVVLEN